MLHRWYIANRVARTLLTLIVVASLNFWLFRVLPGNPLSLIAREGRLDPATIESLKRSFGLDKSMGLQYLLYLKNLATLNLGFSYVSRQSVLDVTGRALVNSLILVVCGYVVIVLGGILLGVIAGARRGTRTDAAIVMTSMGLWSVPTFWLALMLLVVFSVHVGVFPVFGMSAPGAYYSTPMGRVSDIAWHLVLPTVALAAGSVANFVLIMRNSVADTLDEDYVLTARAKGLSKRRILWSHVVPNAFLPTFTLTSLYLGLLLASTIQVEVVFSWPGIGLLMLQAVTTRDYPVLEAAFFIIAVVVIVGNLVSDLFYTRLDPRIVGA